MIEFGRELTGRVEMAQEREWLCANGLGGFASGTVAGGATRRYHGLLVAALTPPVGRTLVLAPGAQAEPAHGWYRGFRLTAEEARGLDALDDNLRVGAFDAALEPGRPVICVLSVEAEPALDGEQAWQRRRAHEALVLLDWRKTQPAAGDAPPWIEQLVLAADQFLVGRPLAADPDRRAGIARCHWVRDLGRGTPNAL